MRTRDAVRKVEIVRMFPVVESTVVEGVEDELAAYTEQIDRTAAVFFDESARRSKILAIQNLGIFVVAEGRA